jgi:putative nucleotidyltransferase with HDIG domain
MATFTKVTIRIITPTDMENLFLQTAKSMKGTLLMEIDDNFRSMARNSKVLLHSTNVARAAFLIAKETGSMDPVVAYTAGMMHDIGRLYILEEDRGYQHPLVGYNMFSSLDPRIADTCITHPFPVADLYEYIPYYCRGDQETANQIASIIQKVENNEYIRLIQLCDKISGLDSYVTIRAKFKWYKERKYDAPQSFIEKNYEALLAIKDEFEAKTGLDIYRTLGATENIG